MRLLTLAAALLATTAFATPASAAPTAAALTCDVHLQAFGSGEGRCSLTGVANGGVYALQDVDVDLFGVVAGPCMATGNAIGHIGAPVDAGFAWTWVGAVGVVTFSGATTGAGTTEMLLVAGNPCFSPEMSYAVVMELVGT